MTVQFSGVLHDATNIDVDSNIWLGEFSAMKMFVMS